MNPGHALTAAFVNRLALGAMFLAHGLLKVFVFTLPGTAGFFESVGFPGWTAYPVTLAEIAGGAALILRSAAGGTLGNVAMATTVLVFEAARARS